MAHPGVEESVDGGRPAPPARCRRPGIRCPGGGRVTDGCNRAGGWRVCSGWSWTRRRGGPVPSRGEAGPGTSTASKASTGRRTRSSSASCMSSPPVGRRPRRSSRRPSLGSGLAGTRWAATRRSRLGAPRGDQRRHRPLASHWVRATTSRGHRCGGRSRGIRSERAGSTTRHLPGARHAAPRPDDREDRPGQQPSDGLRLDRRHGVWALGSAPPHGSDAGLLAKVGPTAGTMSDRAYRQAHPPTPRVGRTPPPSPPVTR